MNITTTSIRTLYDLGKTYYDIFKGIELEEFFEMFQKHDTNGFVIPGSEMNFESLGQAVLNSGYITSGEFIEGSTYKSGGHTVYGGFTWKREAFDDDFWNALEEYYGVSAE